MQPCMQRGYGLTLAQHQGGQWEAGCGLRRGRCSGHEQVSSHLAPCPWAATPTTNQTGQVETCRLQEVQVQRTWCAVWRWRVELVDPARKGDEMEPTHMSAASPLPTHAPAGYGHVMDTSWGASGARALALALAIRQCHLVRAMTLPTVTCSIVHAPWSKGKEASDLPADKD